jgi:HlyD family secretion protein
MIKKIIRYLFVSLILLGILWTFMFLYNKSQEPPVVYSTTGPFETTVIKKTVATGSVIPRKEVNMKSQVSGIIEKLFIVAGQEVKQGDVIARIKIIPNMLNLANAENRVNQAKINFENAKLEFERNDNLFKQSVISKSDFQQVELRFRNAEEEYKAAENNLQLIKEGVTKDAGSATNTLVRSTITGMVLDVPVKEGGQVIESNTFNEGTTISSVANMGEMIFEGKLDESEVGKVQVGMPIELTVGAIDKEKFAASLEYISPKGVTENGAIQFVIRAKVDKGSIGSSFLRAGYSANADIILMKKDEVLVISESVLQFEGEKPFVEVEKSPNVYEKKFVKTGLSDGINIEILEGIVKTDRIKVPRMGSGPAQIEE